MNAGAGNSIFKKTCCKAKKNEAIKLFNDIRNLSWNSVYELKDGGV
jgi:hypothetical protein